ncbi:10643_t:CDS:2 [Entrophospora sp. SA101]|nr:10093_t:CDS:2 [Entrophospora sp. SA101]CAJ0637438.1 10643_t:CDS:2 [Entrophospora sp. SA101]CAJ0832689.1 10410_t:CDS:2 [Entrophospora sp. SA101]
MDQDTKETITKYLEENISNIQFKTLRPGEVEASDDEKIEIMRKTLEDPALFLSKWGKYLPADLLSKFETFRSNDYEVNWYLSQLENDQRQEQILLASKNLEPKNRRNKKILNRRYQYLIKNLDNTEYLSDESIESREPLLYEDYVGKYIPNDERYPPFDQNISLVDRMLYNIDLSYIQNRLIEEKIIQEEHQENLNQKIIDNTNDNDGGTILNATETITVNNTTVSTTTETANIVPDQQIIISDEERQQLRNELVDIMRNKFLSGNDVSKYDDIKTEEQGIQDQYFDTEEPDEKQVSTDTGVLDY